MHACIVKHVYHRRVERPSETAIAQMTVHALQMTYVERARQLLTKLLINRRSSELELSCSLMKLAAWNQTITKKMLLLK